jgi:transketolase
MVVICPGDAWEVRAALRAVMRDDRPAYIRMGKKGEPKVHKGPVRDFQIGKAISIVDGDEVCLLSTGNMLPEAVEAGRALNEHGVSTAVVSFHTVKPLDEACLSDALKKFKLVVTAEEHSLIGGFGAAVAEWAVDTGADTRKLLRVGTPDRFFKESGEQEHAREQLGLAAHHIVDRVIARLSSS